MPGGEATSGGCPFSKMLGAAAGPPPPQQQQAQERSSTAPGPSCPLGFGASSQTSCPLGFGGSQGGQAAAPPGLPAMPLALLHHHGMHGLVSVKGVVYDVREALELPGQGEVLRRVIGHDISRLLACRGLQDLDDAAADLFDKSVGSGLAYEEVLRLERASEVFSRAYRPIAVLQQQDLDVLLGKASPSAASSSAVPDAESIHSCIEAGNMDELRALLSGAESEGGEGRRRLLLEAACPRTGMTPLHKAVEAGQADMVAVLLEQGADRAARCSLYGDDTPLALARRLQASDTIVALLSS